MDLCHVTIRLLTATGAAFLASSTAFAQTDSTDCTAAMGSSPEFPSDHVAEVTLAVRSGTHKHLAGASAAERNLLKASYYCEGYETARRALLATMASNNSSRPLPGNRQQMMEEILEILNQSGVDVSDALRLDIESVLSGVEPGYNSQIDPLSGLSNGGLDLQDGPQIQTPEP